MNGTMVTHWVGLLAAAGGGEHGGEHGINWWVLGSMMTNAVLFFGFLAVKLRPVVAEGLTARRANMAKALEEARRKQTEAEAKAAEYAARLANLEDEVQRIVASYEAEARADSERMRAETERAVERLSRESEFTIKQEIRKAEGMIRGAAIAATLEVAEQIVKEKITDADRRRLADQYIANLEKSAPSA
jgi:F0F1-type ATP synthase membrane subunit b/b'